MSFLPSRRTSTSFSVGHSNEALAVSRGRSGSGRYGGCSVLLSVRSSSWAAVVNIWIADVGKGAIQKGAGWNDSNLRWELRRPRGWRDMVGASGAVGILGGEAFHSIESSRCREVISWLQWRVSRAAKERRNMYLVKMSPVHLSTDKV